MIRMSDRGFRRLAGGVVLFVSACAPQHSGEMSREAAFPRTAAEEVFATAYRNIADKYIETVALDTVVMEGLRGLSAIDPAITVSRGGGLVTLGTPDRVLANLHLPPANDTRGWAAVTADMVVAGRAESADLRAAPDEKIYEAVLDAALSNLDMFSRYAGAEEARANRAKRDGFGGIGLRVAMEEKAARITEVSPDAPGERAGLKENDRIIRVDGVPVEGMSQRDVLAMLRGPVHSWVRLDVMRRHAHETVLVELERTHIVPATVAETRRGGVEFITIESFNQNTASSIRAALLRARAEMGASLRGVVLDLRGNPGGLLKQAVQVAGLFLVQGDIVSTRGRHPDSVQYYAAEGDDVAAGLPLVVLIDGRSASAAEIVAAALQDRGRAVVVGTTSYGKGTVQTVIRLPNDGEMTLTWSRLVTPGGYALHGLGVRPALCTSVPDGGRSAFSPETRARLADIMAAWRKVDVRAEKQRQELRASCPPRDHPGEEDADLARRVIADPALYARALDIRAAATAERP